MDHVIVRRAYREDLAEILQLQKRAFQTEAEQHGNYEIEPLKQTYESIVSDFSTYSFLKAMCENRIVGSVKYRTSGDTVWIGKLIVDPQFRRRGLGRRLLTEVEKSNSGAVKFQLFTAASSVQNVRLYESVGYGICKRYNDEGQAGLEMVEMIKIKRY